MSVDGNNSWIPAFHNYLGRGYSVFSNTDSEHIVEDVIHTDGEGCESLDDLRDKWKLQPVVLQSFTEPAPPKAASRQTCNPLGILVQLPQLVWESGSACVHLAAVIFSVSSLCVKLTANRIPAFEIVLVRSILCVALTLGTAISRGLRPFFGNRENYVMLALRGLVGTTAMTTMYYAVDSLPLPDAVTIFFTNPAVTAVFAWVMLGELFGWAAVAGCVMSLTGVLLVSRPPFLFGHGEHYGSTQIFGVIMAIVSSVCSALAFICVRIIGKKEPALKLALWFHSASFVTSFFPLLFGWPDKAVVPGLYDTGLMVMVGFTSFGGQLLINRGFQLEQAAKASSINLMQVLYSYVFGLTIFGDHVTLLGGLGSLMVTSGVLIINLRGVVSKASTQPNAKTTNIDEEETRHMLQPDTDTHHHPAPAPFTSTDCSVVEMAASTVAITATAASAPAAVEFFKSGEFSHPWIPVACGVDDAPEMPDGEEEGADDSVLNGSSGGEHEGDVEEQRSEQSEGAEQAPTGR